MSMLFRQTGTLLGFSSMLWLRDISCVCLCTCCLVYWLVFWWRYRSNYSVGIHIMYLILISGMMLTWNPGSDHRCSDQLFRSRSLTQHGAFKWTNNTNCITYATLSPAISHIWYWLMLVSILNIRKAYHTSSQPWSWSILHIFALVNIVQHC